MAGKYRKPALECINSQELFSIRRERDRVAVATFKMHERLSGCMRASYDGTAQREPSGKLADAEHRNTATGRSVSKLILCKKILHASRYRSRFSQAGNVAYCRIARCILLALVKFFV